MEYAGQAPFSRLGIVAGFTYRAAVIGLLRFLGLMNAAVWFGAAVFFTLAADPAATSQEMKDLIGVKNYPYFSVAIEQIVVARYCNLYVACNLLALLYLLVEWFYFGQRPHRLWLGLVVALSLVGLAESYWIQPRLRELHRRQYAQPGRDPGAGRSFRTWQGVGDVANFLLVVGLAAHLWRVANPPDAMRFVSAAKFRG